MTDSLMKFKEVVEKSKSIAVNTGSTEDISKIFAGILLHQAFLKLGKKSSTDFSETETIKSASRVLFGSPLQNFENEENIFIKLDVNKLPISELRYEKDGDLLKIILTSARKSPDLGTILIEKETKPVDLLMLIDPPENQTEELLEKTPHKEVVKLGAKDKSLPLKVAEILKLFFDKIPEEFRETLWFLVKNEGEVNFMSSPELLKLMHELVEAKVDTEKIQGVKNIIFGQNFWKLFGRTLARSHQERELETLWAFLPKSDFEKTGEKESAVLKILNEMRSIHSGSKFFALLWEAGSNIKAVNAIIASNDQGRLKTLAGLMGTTPASSYFFVKGLSTFSEAELKIRDFIKKVL